MNEIIHEQPIDIKTGEDDKKLTIGLAEAIDIINEDEDPLGELEFGHNQGLSNGEIKRIKKAAREKISDKLKGIENFDQTKYLETLNWILKTAKARYTKIKAQLTIEKNSEKKEKLKRDLEILFMITISCIGIINKKIGLPFESKMLYQRNIDIINEIKDSGGKVKRGENCYLTPGSLDSIIRLKKKGVLNLSNINIQLGNGVNVQESIAFVKLGANESSNEDFGRFEEGDKIENIDIKTGDDCSFAHGCNIFGVENQNGNYEINLELGHKCFLGIGTLIGSGTKVGNGTSVWWSSKIGTNCNIGKNVTIGAGVNIENEVKIPDYSLILNGAKITSNTKVVTYEEYMDKYHRSDSKNFIIRLSKDNTERDMQLKTIGKLYNDINQFNIHNVVPENKAFAVIDSMLKFIEENTLYQISKEYEFESNKTDIEISVTTDGEFRPKSRKTRLYLQKYPKDKFDFVFKYFPYIVKTITDGGKIDHTYLDGIFDEPEIIIDGKLAGNIEEFSSLFIGENIIIGKAKIIGSRYNIIADTMIRLDEMGHNQVFEYRNCNIVRGVIHGPGDKKVEDTTITKACVHGKHTISNSKLGQMGSPCVLNAADLENIHVGGNTTLHNCHLSDGVIGRNVTIVAENPQPVKKDNLEGKWKIKSGSVIS